MKKLALLFAFFGISFSIAACDNTGKLSAPSISLNEEVISWGKIKNAEKYSIYQNNEFLCNVLNNNFEISVTDSGDYSYYVIAKGDNKTYFDSDKSNTVTYHFEKTQTLTAPVAEINSNIISWSGVANATGYYVNLNNIYVCTVTTTSYTVPEHPVGGYTYTVQAFNNKEVSPLSNKVVYQNNTGVNLNSKTEFTIQDLTSDWSVTKGQIDNTVTEGYDLTANTASFVYTNITNEKKFLVFSARAFVRDGEIAPELFVKVDGDNIFEADTTKEYVCPYSDNPIRYAYDLSEYVGKNVFVSLETRNGTHCCITELSFVKEYGASIARCYQWSKNELFDDWSVKGCSELNEGVDFASSGKAEIILNVRAALSLITIRLRMFVGQDEEDAKFQLKVNGNPLVAKGQIQNYICVDHTTDSEQTFSYDLSSFNGQTVKISMGSYDTTVNHCCMTSCKITGQDGESLMSDQNEWDFTKESGIADWNVKKCSLITEGLDLGGNGYAYVRVKITDQKKFLVVNSRMFAGQDTNNAVLMIMVNETPIIPQGASSELITHDHTSDNTVNTKFDLSSYLGRIISIKLYSFESSVNHLVVMNAKLMAQ